MAKRIRKPALKLSFDGLTRDEIAYQTALDILGIEGPLTCSRDELAERLRSKYGARGLMGILELGLQGMAFKKLYQGNFSNRPSPEKVYT